MYVFVKLLSAFLSAVTLSAIFTLRERPSLFDHYSAEYVFLNGSFVLFTFFFLGGIPLSMAADRIAYRRKRKRVWQLALYFLFGAGLWFLFDLWRHVATPVKFAGSLEMAILFGVAGVVFFVYQSLILIAIRSLKKKRRLISGTNIGDTVGFFFAS